VIGMHLSSRGYIAQSLSCVAYLLISTSSRATPPSPRISARVGMGPPGLQVGIFC
jgi:hypothetical protein